MNFDEAKKALIEGYARFGFTYGFRSQTEDAAGVYLTRGSKFIIKREDIQSYADFQERKSSFESFSLNCGICSASYREHLLVPTNPYPYSPPAPFFQGVGIGQKVTFGKPTQKNIYAEISPLSNDFLNFYRFNKDFNSSFNTAVYGRGFRMPPPPGNIPPEQVNAVDIKVIHTKTTTIKVYNLSETNVQKAIEKSSKIIEDCLFQLSYLKRVALWLMEEWPNKKRFSPALPQSFQFTYFIRKELLLNFNQQF